MKFIFTKIFLLFLVNTSIAQDSTASKKINWSDSVVQLYGVVMSADSLKGLNGAYIKIKGQNRGTISNRQGVFSIAVLRGDEVEITHVSHQAKEGKIPFDIEGKQFSMIAVLAPDTNYLPTIIVKNKPSSEQFARDFVNTDVPADEVERARKQLSEERLRVLARLYEKDGKESVNLALRNVSNSYYSKGQVPPMRLLDPNAWREFVQAWKRGDFKKKKR
jgi:hypothetical protein